MVQQQSEYIRIDDLLAKDAPTRVRAAEQLGIASRQRLEDLDYEEYLAVVAGRLAGWPASTPKHPCRCCTDFWDTRIRWCGQTLRAAWQNTIPPWV